ncbi:E3 ubiquitin-protein ligase TRIM71-like [Magallana gigas]|uniref:E3 ubiquitin-protein ligase TRIM71-like n=1 Tax=Magallana gigas TaxID=29159 RepID=UPI003340DB62
MATSHIQEQNLNEGVSLCSICLEQYKSPVSLHCSHSFCRTCLSTHIKSSCGDCDPPLGFPCPLCRVFIPAPGEIDQYSVDEWVTKFPVNKFLTSVAGVCVILCKPCQEDGEEMKANSWCKDCSEALCEDCTKYHKKCRPSRQHIVISITDWSDISQSPDKLEICKTHGGRKFELFCEKHFLPCCSVCVTTDHNSCSNFCQLEEVGKNFIESEKVKVLQSGIERFRLKVENIIEKEKANINQIDDVTDIFTKELSDFTQNIIQALKKLEEEHLNELSKLSKESKSKLQKSVDSFEQRLLYLKHWRKLLSKDLSNETASETKRFLSYIKLKNIHESLQKLKYTKLNICIKTKLLDDVKKLTKLPRLADVSADENLDQVNLNVKNIDYIHAKVNKISEFTIQGANIKGGTFMSSGNLFLADLDGRRCILCDTNGVILQEVKLQEAPWDVFTEGEEILVTNPKNKSILKIDSTSLEIIETVPVGCSCNGIATSGNTTAISTSNSVEIFYDSFDVTKRRTLSSGIGSVFDVVIDDENNVICTSPSKNVVKKLDLQGNVLFTYNHKELKYPYGVTTDSEGNIFINGFISNNIHILSRVGKLLRIVEGVTNPRYIKFQNATQRFFVSSLNGNVKVFEFNER